MFLLYRISLNVEYICWLCISFLVLTNSEFSLPFNTHSSMHLVSCGDLSFPFQSHLSCMFQVLLLTMLMLLVYLLGSFCLRRGGRSGVGARLRKLFLCSSAINPPPAMQSKFSELTSPLTAVFCWLYRSLFLHRLVFIRLSHFYAFSQSLFLSVYLSGL